MHSDHSDHFKKKLLEDKRMQSLGDKNVYRQFPQAKGSKI